MNSEKLFKTLFNDHEKVCFAMNPYGTAISDWHDILRLEDAMKPEFFCINPLHTSRKDINCTAYRNFLIEFDSLSLQKQMKLIEDIGLPYSTCVYSGSKSFHFIISLENELPDIEAFREMKNRIYSALKDCDKSTGNPSRLSRMPNAMRGSTGKTQSLVRLNGRVPTEKMETWLDSRGCKSPTPEQKVERVERLVERKIKNKQQQIERSNDPDWFNEIFLNRWTKHFLANGAKTGDTHRHIIMAACDFFKNGFSEKATIDRLAEANQKSLSEVESAVCWAWGQCEEA